MTLGVGLVSEQVLGDASAGLSGRVVKCVSLRQVTRSIPDGEVISESIKYDLLMIENNRETALQVISSYNFAHTSL